MPKAKLKHDGEHFESLMRRWKKLVEKADTLKDARKYEAYEKPTELRKRRKAAAVKREYRRVYEGNINRPSA
jgi:small subunit ribosomal protein S21